MSRMYIMRGLPGSGKTYAAQQIQAVSGAAIISRDELRLGLFNHPKSEGIMAPEDENAVTDAALALAEAMVKTGKDIIIDDTNLRPKYVRTWRKWATRRDMDVEIVEIPTPIETCIARDAERTYYVGARTIRYLADKFMPGGEFLPIPDEPLVVVPRPYQPKWGLPEAVLVDIDGTVALMDGRTPHEYDKVLTDVPNTPVVWLVQSLQVAGERIVFMSGRPESARADTLAWLEDYVTVEPELYMRATGDMRPDYIVKQELFDEHIRDIYNVLYTIDDRQQVVNMWRSMGLTCLQVAPGDF